MTILYTDNFETDTPGSIAPGWTAISGTWTVGTTLPVSGTQSFSNTSNVDGQVAVYTSGSTSQADQEFITYQIAGTNGYNCPIVRSNAAGTTYYVLTFSTAGLGRVYKNISGTLTAINAAFAFGAPTAGHVIALSLRLSGTTVEARVWDVTAGSSRPSTPTQTFTDASIATGTAGLYWGKGAGGSIGSVDNVAWADGTGVPAATAITMTGPTTGVVSVASTNFTVGANGTITGTVVVTPSDSGAGGTFTPTTVSITAISPTGAFTYTPASTGAKTISETNNGSLTDATNITYTATSGSATATTLSGPTSGVNGVASTSFTVGANGAITGTVIVTPSDGGGGGTFSPTTVSISSGSPTGTFTYTPGSVGAKTISTTNNGSLTNPTNITYTVSAGSTTLAVDTAGITWSPGNWDTLLVADFGVSVKSMQTTACGAYAKFSMIGTTALSLALDSTTLSGFGVNAPYLMWSIGDGAMQYSLVTPGASSLSLATGLTAGTTYTVQIYLRGAAETQGDRWGSAGVSPTNVLRIQGFTVDFGASFSAYPLVRAKNAHIFGDSRTESVRAAGTTTEPQDHARSWAWFLGRALGCEIGVIGYGATGWAQAGSGNMPAFPTSFPLYSVGRSRSFSNVDYVFVMHGFNGTTVQATVQTWIGSARTAYGANTWIFVVSDVSGIGTAASSAAVAAYIAANPTDVKVAYLDISDTIEQAPFSGPISLGTPTWGAVDKCHPLEFAQGLIGAAVARKAQAIAGGAVSATTTRTVTITLVDATGIPRASLSGLKWSLYDKAQGNVLLSAVDSGSAGSTNASGVMTLSVKTTLAAGANAWLVISDSDGTLTQSPAAKAFAGPVLLS